MSVDFNALVLGPTSDAFADPATFIPAAGGTITTLFGPNQGRGVFDEGHSLLGDVGGDVPTSTARPVLGIRLSEFTTAPVQNDKVQIPKVDCTYIVKDVQPDSHGHALLILQLVSSP